jgi:dCMP deaminase
MQTPLSSGSRLTKNEYFLRMAELASQRGTCARRKVGCVLVDRYNHVLATGYNGVAAGRPHCIDAPCPGASYASGQGLHLCEAVHAEQNALIQCRDTMTIETAYCTASPCVHCLRMLLNTSCKRIVFRELYPHAESANLWMAAGRDWIHIP